MKGMRLARPLRDNPLGAFNVRNIVSEHLDMKKNVKKIVTLVLTFLAISTAITYNVVFADVVYKVKVNNVVSEIKAPRGSVQSVLDKAGVSVSSEDRVSHELNAKASEDEVIEVHKARLITVKDGESSTTITTTYDTVSDILTHAGYTLGEKDTVERSGDTITITRIVVTTNTTTEDIAYESKEVESADLPKGERKVTTAGKNGKKEVTRTITAENGKEKSIVLDKEVVTEEPVTEIVQVGTKVTQPSVRLSNGNTAGATGAEAAQEMARRTGVPASTWETIIARESNGNPNAYNPSGASGLFQTMPGWGSTATVPDQIEAATRAYKAQGLGAWGF